MSMPQPNAVSSPKTNPKAQSLSLDTTSSFFSQDDKELSFPSHSSDEDSLAPSPDSIFGVEQEMLSLSVAKHASVPEMSSAGAAASASTKNSTTKQQASQSTRQSVQFPTYEPVAAQLQRGRSLNNKSSGSASSGPAASSLMTGIAGDMQARILALQASRPNRDRSHSGSTGSPALSPRSEQGMHGGVMGSRSSLFLGNQSMVNSPLVSPRQSQLPLGRQNSAHSVFGNPINQQQPQSQPQQQAQPQPQQPQQPQQQQQSSAQAQAQAQVQAQAHAESSNVLAGAAAGAVADGTLSPTALGPNGIPSGALAFNTSGSNIRRTTSLSERRGVHLNRPNRGPGTLSEAKAPQDFKLSLPEGKSSRPSVHFGAEISGSGRPSMRLPTRNSGQIPNPPSSAASASRRPKLSLQNTQAPEVPGITSRRPSQQPVDQGVAVQDMRSNDSEMDRPNLFSAYKKYIDIESGSLNFAGKAVLHSYGIDFSSGTSFRITLDELELISELGAGNYGTVTKVLHKPTKVCMAMKEIRLELEESKFQQILMELDILHRCQFSDIVEFYGAFFVEGAVYVCMEYMDGGSINQIYEDGIPEDQLAYITYHVVNALRQLKDDFNIIHRDVKPTNILCSTSGTVKLCDFGVSGNLVASIAKTNIGCQAYMAPERIRSSGSVQNSTYTVESDVWSLGLTIIEMAEGAYPYPPESYSNIFSQLSAIVDGKAPTLDSKKFSTEACSFVRECLQKNPKQRPTYAQLLQHPWLANRDFGPESVTAMGSFVRQRKSAAADKTPKSSQL